MPEGLSASEVGKEISEHAKHADPHERRDQLISITEAILLSVVALLAAWSGYAASKWATESRVELATAASLRIEGSRGGADAFELRSYDASTFESWFSAYIAGNTPAMRLAERRFRPDFKGAFDAWRGTKPETDRDASGRPTHMPHAKLRRTSKRREVTPTCRSTSGPVRPRLGPSMSERKRPCATARRTALPPTSTAGARSARPESSA